MPLKQSRQVGAGAPVPSALDGVSLVEITGEYTIRTGDLANDVIELGGIPPGCDVVDFVLSHDGVGGTVDVGVLSGTYGRVDHARTCGNELAAGAATATAGVLRMTKPGTGVARADTERGWGIKLLAAPTVGKVIRATLFVAPVGV